MRAYGKLGEQPVSPRVDQAAVAVVIAPCLPEGLDFRRLSARHAGLVIPCLQRRQVGRETFSFFIGEFAGQELAIEPALITVQAQHFAAIVDAIKMVLTEGQEIPPAGDPRC